MPALEKYRIRGDFKIINEITDLIGIGASSSGISDYHTYTDKDIVTSKTEFTSMLATSTGYVTLNLSDNITIYEDELPLTIGDNVKGIISYQDESDTANVGKIKVLRYCEEDDGHTLFVSNTHQNAIDIISAGTKEVPFKTLQYAIGNVNSTKTKICILDNGNYSSENKITFADLSLYMTVYSNYFPTMPEINANFEHTNACYKVIFKGLKWNGRNVITQNIPKNFITSIGHLKFLNCQFYSIVLDIFQSNEQYSSDQFAMHFPTYLMNSVLQNCTLKMGRYDSCNIGRFYFCNNRLINCRSFFEGKLHNDVGVYIKYNSFVNRSANPYDIKLKGNIHFHYNSVNASTTYSIYSQGVDHVNEYSPNIQHNVYNKGIQTSGKAPYISNNNWLDSGKNKIETYENIAFGSSLSSIVRCNSEDDYIGSNHVGYSTSILSIHDHSWKSYLFTRSNGLLFENIEIDGMKHVDSLFEYELTGESCEIRNCTIKNFTGKVSKSRATKCKFFNNTISFEYSGGNSIERNIFAFNDIGFILSGSDGTVINHNTLFSNLVGFYNLNGNDIQIKNNIIYNNISHSIKTVENLALNACDINVIDILPPNLDITNGTNINFNPFFKNELKDEMDLHLRTKEEGYDFDSVAKQKSDDIPVQDLGVYNVKREFKGFSYDLDFYIDRPNPKKRTLKEINAIVNISRTGKIFTNKDQTLIEEITLSWSTLDETDMENLKKLWHLNNNQIEIYELPISSPLDVKKYYIDKRNALNYERIDNFNSGENIYKNVSLKLLRKVEV